MEFKVLHVRQNVVGHRLEVVVHVLDASSQVVPIIFRDKPGAHVFSSVSVNNVVRMSPSATADAFFS